MTSVSANPIPDRPATISRRTLDMLDIPRRYRSTDYGISPHVAIRNVAADLAVVKRVALRIQENRDRYDKYDHERGWEGPASYEANLTREEEELDCHLVTLGVLHPRLPKPPVEKLAVVTSPERLKASSVLRSLRRPSLRSVKKAFSKPFRNWTPISMRSAQQLPVDDAAQRRDLAKGKNSPRPRANSCPQPFVNPQHPGSPLSAEELKRIVEVKEPPSDNFPALRSVRRCVLSDSGTSGLVRPPVASINAVCHQGAVGSRTIPKTSSQIFNKPISEITPEDVQAIPPSVIVQRVIEELQGRKEVKRAAATAARTARERQTAITGEGMHSVTSSCLRVVMKATPVAFLAVVGAVFAVLSVVDMVLDFYEWWVEEEETAE